MSFNVWGSLRHRAKEVLRRTAALDVAVIERYGPDLIGLQECQRGTLRKYRKRLPHYAQVRGPGYGNVVTHHFNAILFDPERLEPLDSGGFWLSETPDKYSRNRDTKIVRAANWTLFRVTEAGLPLLHLNTHLDHESGLARREGSRLIIERAEKLTGRSTGDAPSVVLTGDFNSRPGSPTYRNFAEAGFADTFLAAGNEDTGGSNTFHDFEGARFRDAHPGRGPLRLDWILLKDPRHSLRVEAHTIVRDGDEISGLYPSDHYPVLAELSFTG